MFAYYFIIEECAYCDFSTVRINPCLFRIERKWKREMKPTSMIKLKKKFLEMIISLWQDDTIFKKRKYKTTNGNARK